MLFRLGDSALNHVMKPSLANIGQLDSTRQKPTTSLQSHPTTFAVICDGLPDRYLLQVFTSYIYRGDL